jgi:hypothetical protein
MKNNGALSLSLLTAVFLAAVTVIEICSDSVKRRESPLVSLTRVPGGGYQPQAVVDKGDRIHLAYYVGKPAAGDLYYSHTDSGSPTFSEPIRINSQPGSAVAAGTIRGVQLALGRNGRIHSVWNGSGQAVPKPPGGGSPLLYSRLADGKFEPQRNLMSRTTLLDGGGTVAADSAGRVYAVWHAADGSSTDEAARKLWIARSSDDGTTFEPESAAYDEPTGACPCCSTRALADSKGILYTLYRGAVDRIDRDMLLLVSRNSSKTFRGAAVHPWKVPT